MPIPDLDSIHLPLLKSIGDGKKHNIREVTEILAAHFSVTPEERQQFTEIGRKRTFDTRVSWAVSQLRHSGLLENTERGIFKITERGRDALKLNPDKIDRKFLLRYDEFREYIGPKQDRKVVAVVASEEKITPFEIIEDNYLKIKKELAERLLEEVKRAPPGFFERMVIKLIVKMGYGGSEKDAAEVIGKKGDEGIDGIIKEDLLGLDKIYVQAKRWKGTVGSPPIREFVGSLGIKQARKGIFITTGSFTKDALATIKEVDSGVIFIDGNELADLMIDHDIGVALEKSYEVKRIDLEFFEE